MGNATPAALNINDGNTVQARQIGAVVVQGSNVPFTDLVNGLNLGSPG